MYADLNKERSEVLNRLDRIEVALPHAAVYLWEPTEDDVREAVRAKARMLGIPEACVEAHCYRWIED
jgi:hypothetical protein